MARQRSRKVRIGEFVFDSQHEANRYMFLLSQAQAGVITDFQPRPIPIEIAPFIILPKNELRHAKVIRQSRVYTPDFSYTYQGVEVFEDVKASYSKNNKKRKKGAAIVSEASRLRMRLVQGQRPNCVVVMVMVVTWWWGESGGHKLL